MSSAFQLIDDIQLAGDMLVAQNDVPLRIRQVPPDKPQVHIGDLSPPDTQISQISLRTRDGLTVYGRAIRLHRLRLAD
jgi:hypothetical protein